MTSLHIEQSVERNEFSDRKAWIYLLIFMTVHGFVWVITPILTQPNSPLDNMEMIYWGHEWEFGYYKHPPVAAWLAEMATSLTPGGVWPTYVLAQIGNGISFLCIFLIGKQIVGNRLGLLAAISLEGCYYYNYLSPEFNNGSTARAFAALSVMFLFFALTTTRRRMSLIGWSLSGFAISLSVMARYDAGIVAIIMLLFSVVNARGRAAWRTPGPWLLLATAGLCFLPHLKWMIDYNAPTIAWMQQRSGEYGGLISHIHNPLIFFADQLGILIPLFFVFVSLTGLRWKWKRYENPDQAFGREFILYFGMGPLLFVLGTVLLTGIGTKSVWSNTLWTFSTLAVICAVELQLNTKNYRRTLARAFTLAVVAVVVFSLRNVVLPHYRGKGSRIHFPGQQLATYARGEYRKATGGEPVYVGGPWWEAANVAVYGQPRASVFADLDPKRSPWVDDQKFQKFGGIIVWNTQERQTQFRDEIAERFPSAQFSPEVAIPWQTSAQIEPIRFQIVIVPPANL